jgi:hypothetical protein
MGDGIPTMIGSNLPRGIRHQCYLIGFHLCDQFQKVLGWITLYIKFRDYYRFEIKYVLSADMTLVRPGMNRYSLCSKSLAVDSSLYDIRDDSTPCITQCCYFVYIYAQSSHNRNFKAASYDFYAIE